MGSNSFGQLGVAVPANPSAPAVIDVNASAVAVGLGHTIYLKTDGSLWAVGANEHGQLGLGDTIDRTAPVQITTSVSAVAAGRAHSLFLKTDGTLWAVGDNIHGQLGTGDNLDRSTPVQIASDVATIAAGDDHTLFIKTDGSLWTVGRNKYGQLGDTGTTSRATPAQIATAVLKVAGGPANTLFIKTDHSLWKCGLSGLSAQSTPVQIATSAAAIAVGAAHTLFIKTDATLWVTGNNSSGQLGNGSTVNISTPLQIGSGYSAVAAGFVHSLFLTTTGAVQISGNNSLHQLGGTSSANLATPAQLATSATVIASRQYHSAYITSDGTLWGIGDNTAGQLATAPSSQLAPATLGTGIVATSSGVAHTLSLKSDGTLWSVGDNTYGQLGTGDTLPRAQPVQIASGVASISAGSWHTLFLKTDGTLWGTGRNTTGQLGTGTTIQQSSPVQIATGVTAISAGAKNSLFTKTDATLYGMGDNSIKQISATASPSAPISTPTIITTDVSAFTARGPYSLWIKNYTLYSTPNKGVIATNVRAVAAGDLHALVLKTDGTLWNAGLIISSILNPRDGFFALGTPSLIASDVTTIAAGGLGLGAGEEFSLFVKTDGTLWAMGDNRFGQLGDGTRINRDAPVQIASHVTAINAGDTQSSFVQAPLVAPAISAQPQSKTIAYADHATLQVTATGGFLSYQWFIGAAGDTSHPFPGADGPEALTFPVIQPTSFWVRITNEVGTVDSAAATITPQIIPPGTLSVRGSRARGEFGESLGLLSPRQPVMLDQTVARIAASADHALILKSDGTLWTTGNNAAGQLGTGDTANRTGPVQIASAVSAIAVGAAHSLFLKTDGTLWAMGDNSAGQLGVGNTTNLSTPVQVTSSVSAIAAGGQHSLFLKTDGTLWSMGYNSYGQLGDGSLNQRNLPIQIASAVSAVAAGANHSLFLKTDGTLWTTGRNHVGQLGDGTLIDRVAPVMTASAVSAVAANSNSDHSLFITADASLRGMGANAKGQLGTGDATDRSTPVLIAAHVRACSAGSTHTLYVTDAYSLWSTGGNTYGQLGTGTTADQFSPQEIASKVERATASAYGSLFVTQAGGVYGMGLNGDGLLALPTPSNQPTLATLANDVTAIASAPGKSYYLRSDGALWSSAGLPSGASSAPGIVATNVARLFPIHILKQPGLAGELSETVPRVLFLRTDGSLWGAGDNTTGALGTGDVLNPPAPVHLADDVVDAGSTRRFSVFIKSDGTLWKTGTILYNSTPTAADLAPVQIDDHAVALITSYRHVLYLKADGTLWGLGDSQNGQLGFQTRGNTGLPDVTTPVLVAEQVSAAAVSALHTLFLKTDGSLWGCGYNGFGQIGTATSNLVNPPRLISTGVTSMAAGPETSYFIKTDGTLWATGNNDKFQLGYLQSLTLATTPVQVTTNVSQVIPSATGENAFILNNDGSVSGMGRNDRGQVGSSRTRANAIPIRAQTYAVSGSGLHTLILHDPVAGDPPLITAQPVATSVAFGDFATLAVGVVSPAIVTYQWYQGTSGDTSRPVAGATDATLRLAAFAATSRFWARATNAAGSVDSDSAAVTIVGSGTPGFRTWAEAAGLRGSGLSTTADPDADGRANLLEFAFHTEPDTGDARVSFAVDSLHVDDGDFLVLTHRRGKNTDVAFSYEQSHDLTSWAGATLIPAVTNPDADGDGLVEEVSVALPLEAGQTATFLRVRVTSP